MNPPVYHPIDPIGQRDQDLLHVVEINQKITQLETLFEGINSNFQIHFTALARDLREQVQEIQQQLEEQKREIQEEMQQQFQEQKREIQEEMQQQFQEQKREIREEMQQQLEEQKRQIREEMQQGFQAQLVQLQSRMQNLQPSRSIDQEHLEITEHVLGRGAYGEVRVGIYQGTRVAVKKIHEVIISDYN